MPEFDVYILVCDVIVVVGYPDGSQMTAGGRDDYCCTLEQAQEWVKAKAGKGLELVHESHSDSALDYNPCTYYYKYV